MQIEATGYFKRLVTSKDKTALCFIVTDGEGYDAESFEELFEAKGINLNDIGDETVTISIVSHDA